MSYRSVEDRGPIAVITHPREAILAAVPAHVVSGPDLIRVHTRSEATVVVVRGRVDDGPWTTLEVDEEVGSWWSAPLDGDRLCKGGHTLEVEVCDEEDGPFETPRLRRGAGRDSPVPCQGRGWSSRGWTSAG
jgi:3',5'-cyclic-AMP phosphodiesterase